MRMTCPECKGRSKRRLDVNGRCKKCNRNRGFRQCPKCHELKLELNDFYATRRRCIECISAENRQDSGPDKS